MKLKTFLGISGIFFLLIALLHLIRVLFKINLVVGDYEVPNWMSILVFVVLLLLSRKSLHFRKNLQ